MDISIGKRFRVGARRRFGYPGALLLLAVVALVKGYLQSDLEVMRASVLFFAIAFGMFFYMSLITLRISDEGIGLSWPMMGYRRILWRDVTQLRRGGVPPAGVFVDIIAGVDVSIQVSPYFYDRPDEIIDLISKYLKAAVFSDNPLPSDGIPEAIAVSGETARPFMQTWMLVFVFFALVCVYYFFYMQR